MPPPATSNGSFTRSNFSALICIDSRELRAQAGEQLAELGLEIHTANTVEEAVTELYSHLYDIVVTTEDFCGGDAEIHPILAELASLTLDLRRSMFVVLIGANRVTRSAMDAFSLSVDLVVHQEDTSSLKALVGHGLARQEKFYEAFRAEAKLIQREG